MCAEFLGKRLIAVLGIVYGYINSHSHTHHMKILIRQPSKITPNADTSEVLTGVLNIPGNIRCGKNPKDM